MVVKIDELFLDTKELQFIWQLTVLSIHRIPLSNGRRNTPGCAKAAQTAPEKVKLAIWIRGALPPWDERLSRAACDSLTG